MPVGLENGGANIGGTRRDTITYDKYLDVLAMFHNNGSIYDSIGQIVLQGKIKMTFDGGTWFGWFQSFLLRTTLRVLTNSRLIWRCKWSESFMVCEVNL